MRRLAIATVATLTVAAALTGCSMSGPVVSPTPTSKATTAVSTPRPSATETAVADPKVAEPTTTVPTTPAASPSGSALAQHIYDECSTGAADAGVRLTFTPNPTGYTTTNGRYELIYPFTFLDGHDDPYAVYNCTLTDSTVRSTFVGGGLSDSH